MEKDQVLLNDWHVITRVQELKPGAVLPKRLLGEDIVVWHDGTSIHAAKIISEYRVILESQRPPRLPLDLQAEVNLPSDRYSIVYRKWLKKQGVTFGCI
ncbi:hypothetical protein NIES2101_36115 [Calothrix sp. HK-06]|nr:hypothetical protein NIES2101_36115 [Calothrix sp. HK-06]